MGYGAWLHGEAVVCGLVLAAALSARLGLIEPAVVSRLERLIERAGLPTRAPRMPAQRWLQLMRVDKKAEGGEIRFVLIDGLGRATVRAAPDALVCEVIEAYTVAA